MEYTDEMKEMEDFLDSYSDEGYQGIVEAHGALEYAQFIEKLDFTQAKELTSFQTLIIYAILQRKPIRTSYHRPAERAEI